VSCSGVAVPKMLTIGPSGTTANTIIAAVAAMIGARR